MMKEWSGGSLFIYTKHFVHFDVIFSSEIFDRHLALGILRLPNGLDYSHYGRFPEIIACISENGMSSGGRILNAYVDVDLSKNESGARLDLCKDNLTKGPTLTNNNSSSSQLSQSITYQLIKNQT